MMGMGDDDVVVACSVVRLFGFMSRRETIQFGWELLRCVGEGCGGR